MLKFNLKRDRITRQPWFQGVLLMLCVIVAMILANTPEDLKKKDDLWKYLRSRDYFLYLRLRNGIFGLGVNLPGRGGRALTAGGYKIVRHFFQFN